MTPLICCRFLSKDVEVTIKRIVSVGFEQRYFK